MTREEARARAEQFVYCNCTLPKKAVRKMGEWIKVSERLPEAEK